jgi:hypothetical protein
MVRESGPRPVPGRSSWSGTRGLGFTPRLARFHALHAGTARGPWAVGRDRSPVAAGGLARGVGISTMRCSFSRAARRDGARSVREWTATGPRSQHLDWHERVGVFTTRCLFPRAARRDGARSVGSGPRPVPGRSTWLGTSGFGFSPRVARCARAARRDGARSVGSGPRPVPSPSVLA